VAELLEEWFACEPLRAALAATALAHVQQGPRSGGTAFGLLHQQVGTVSGGGSPGSRGYWTAGPEALVAALAATARKHGVEIRAGAEVQHILAQDYRVTGVALAGGEEATAGLVLSTLDPARTLLGLVDPVWLDPEFLLAVRNVRFRGSTAFISYALAGLPAFTGLPDAGRVLSGTLSLSGSVTELERAADAAKYGRVSERPHVRLRFPSLRWAEQAPPGRHVMVAEVQWVPYRLRSGAWDAAARDALADRVGTQLEEAAPGLGSLVIAREVQTPVELEQRYGLTEGAVTQGEMTLDQILFMRPVAGAARYATPLDGLYLAGAGSHPGYGVSGGPGWLSARAALAAPPRS
jgi:phytoene dehydrogenase-like protein